MRAVVQRVSSASVSIENIIKSEISIGLLILLGVEVDDTIEDADWLSSKIANLRIFDDAKGVMNLSIIEIGGQVLSVSQFTLHAKTKKGNRPSYIKAAKPEMAILLYEEFNKRIESQIGQKVQTGIFRANMKVSIVNEGPVTIIIDTKNKE